MIGHSGYVPQRVCLSFLECLSLFLSVPVVVSASAPSMHDTQYEFENSRQSRNVGFVPTVPPRQEQDFSLRRTRGDHLSCRPGARGGPVLLEPPMEAACDGGTRTRARGPCAGVAGALVVRALWCVGAPRVALGGS